MLTSRIMPESEGVLPNKLSRHAPAGRAVPSEAIDGHASGSLEGQWADTRVELFQSATAALGSAIARVFDSMLAGLRNRGLLGL